MLRPATLAVSLEGTHPLFFVRDDLLDATRPDCFLSAAVVERKRRLGSCLGSLGGYPGEKCAQLLKNYYFRWVFSVLAKSAKIVVFMNFHDFQGILVIFNQLANR